MSQIAPLPDFSKLLDSGDYSDLQIKCGSQTFAVHRAIVCAQSDFFRAACSNNFLEGQTGVINLPEDSTPLEKMVRFLYTCRYDNPFVFEHPKLRFHIDMVILGDKYAILRLRDLAVMNFSAALSKQEDLEAFVHIIPLVYESAPQLRADVVGFATTHRQELMHGEDVLRGSFRTVLGNIADFSMDFIERLSSIGEHEQQNKQAHSPVPFNNDWPGVRESPGGSGVVPGYF